MCFEPAQTRVWNDQGIPYTVFDTGKLDEFKDAVNVGCFPEFIFQFFRGAGVCGVA